MTRIGNLGSARTIRTAALRRREGMTKTIVGCGCSASSGTRGDALIAAGNRMWSGFVAKPDSSFHLRRPCWLSYVRHLPEADAICTLTIRYRLWIGRSCGLIWITCEPDATGAIVRRPCVRLRGGPRGAVIIPKSLVSNDHGVALCENPGN